MFKNLKNYLKVNPILIFIPVFLSFPALAQNNNHFFINGKPVPDIVARVNGFDIKSGFLVNELKAWRIFAEKRGTIRSIEDEKQFIQDKLDQAIDQELLYQKSREMSIKISQVNIQKEIENLQKKFPSRKMFLSAIAFQKLTLTKLANKIEKRLAEEELLRKKLVPSVEVSEGMVKAYYEKNKPRFRTPVKFLVSHIFIATLSSGEVSSENHADREKARRIINMINGQAKVKIQKINKRLKEGDSFVSLCKAFSEDDATKDKGGTMGEVELEQMIPSLAKTIAELKLGQTSEIVESPHGYHILKLDGKVAEKQISLNNVKADILNILLKKKLEKKREEYLRDLRKTADIKTFF